MDDYERDEYDPDNPQWLQKDREEWGDGYDDDLAQRYGYGEIADYDDEF